MGEVLTTEKQLAKNGLLELLQRSRFFCPAELGAETQKTAVASEIKRLCEASAFRPSRDYNTMTLAVDCKSWEHDTRTIRDILPRLVELHFWLQFRRQETGKIRGLPDDLYWQSALHNLGRTSFWRGTAGNENDKNPSGPRGHTALLARLAKTDFGRKLSVFGTRSRGACLNMVCLAALRIGYWRNSAAGLRNGFQRRGKHFTSDILRHRRSAKKTSVSTRLDVILSHIVCGSRKTRTKAAKLLVGRFCDLTTGLVHKCPRGKRAKAQLFLGPKLLLALVVFAKREKIPIGLQGNRFRETLTVPMDETGNPDAAIASLDSWDLQNKTPPRLPAAWGPGPPTFGSAEADDVTRRILRRTIKGLRSPQLVPDGASFVLSIRHDVDRTLGFDELERILNFEEARGIKSSWFFKPDTYDSTVARLLLERGCELGYHCSDAGTGDRGFAERLLAEFPGEAIGMTFHGGFGSFYWDGVTTLRRIARLGFTYAEWPADIFLHPRPWPWRKPELYLVASGVKIQSRPKFFEEHLHFIIGHHGHAVLENHPDLFNQKFAGTIDKLLDAGGAARLIGKHVEVCRSADTEVFRSFGQSESLGISSGAGAR